MRKRTILLLTIGGFVAAIYLFNASWLSKAPEGELSVLSHRGVHQTFHRKDLTNETCTAKRIDAPTHDYLENTIDSFAAAIDFGANIIELDIQPTTDGEFVVFHDWTLDCRTNGTGRVRDHKLSDLQLLDIGYGYRPNNGQDFPFRGRYVGQMPTLIQVLQAFPRTYFMINIKSRSKAEASALMIIFRKTNGAACLFQGPPLPYRSLRHITPIFLR